MDDQQQATTAAKEAEYARERLSPKSEEWSPFKKNQVENGVPLLCMLPENIYSAMILVHLNNGGANPFDGKFSWRELLWVEMPIFAVYLVTLVGQLISAIWLLDTVYTTGSDFGDDDLVGDCTQNTPLARWTILVALVMYTMADFAETVRYHIWLSQFPRAEKFEELHLQEFEDKAFQEAHKHDEARTIIRPVSGITNQTRVQFYCFLLIPKAVMTFTVMFAGSGVVVRASSDLDLILNGLAATFILELDDFTYAALIPEGVKLVAGSVPPLGVPWVRAKSYVHLVERFYSYGMIAVCAVVSIAMTFGIWCGNGALVVVLP